MLGEFPEFTQKKLIEPKKLAAFSDEVRRKGKKLVTLNGSFDLLHAGHLHIRSARSIAGRPYPGNIHCHGNTTQICGETQGVRYLFPSEFLRACFKGLTLRIYYVCFHFI